MEQYVQAILRNIRHYSPEDAVDTIYFGGGTPSLLRISQIASILDACAKHLHLAQHPEITLELNPSGDRSDYLRELHSIGVNRLSIGTQSFSDGQLRLLGRTHTAENGIRTVHAAADAGFQNISCDLILACPEQSEEVLRDTLRTLTSLPITHVSSYLLQVEEGTPLSKDVSLLSRLPDEDSAVDRYLQAVHHLEKHGFLQYEVSSFAKQGFESRHNLKYWNCEPYLGIGSGAHSYYQGKRFCVPKDLMAFCRTPVQPTELIDDAPCSMEERLMLALRTTKGISRNALTNDAEPCICQLRQAGYLKTQPEDNIVLTPEGFAVSNAVIAMLLEYISETAMK